ncbi:DDE superfamily endonuclease [Ceratobasidium sp. AG-Ba]|nr:DDE superfamily endonuclease [Ceratobasidium sp. AG-Ba]QRW04654.1 DDE superfamily endonuclease [Ceratobasidium sp. AG-Ba]
MQAQQTSNQPFCCAEISRIIMRMVALGYYPYTISMCTGIPEHRIHETIKTFFSAGYNLSQLHVSPYYLWPPPPSGHQGFYAYQAVAPPPPMPTSMRGQPSLHPYSRPLPQAPERTTATSTTPSSAQTLYTNAPPTHLPPFKFQSPEGLNYGIVLADRPSAVPFMPNLPQQDRIAIEEAEPMPSAEVHTVSGILSAEDIKALGDYIQLCPSVTLDELRGVLEQRRVHVSLFRMIRVMHQSGVEIPNTSSNETHKQARQDYAVRVGEFDPSHLVFIGQVACNVRYGWSYLGRTRRPKFQKFIVGFALSYDGIIGPRIWTDIGDDDVYGAFVDYARQWMQPFPQPKSVVLLDRRGVSEESGVLEDIKACGMKHIFIPPGSADYNPTKQAIVQIKSNIANVQQKLGEAETKDDAENILHHEVFSIPKEQAQAWFRECGYA